MLRIAFFYNHDNCFGHSCRVFNIIKAIRRRFNDKVMILLVQSGPRQPFFMFSDYVDRHIVLPYSFGKKALQIDSNREVLEAFVKTPFYKTAIAQRSKLLLEEIGRFKPHIFITEYVPFGDYLFIEEMYMVLKEIRSSVPFIVSSAGYVSYFDGMADFFPFYDLCFIHTPYNLHEEYVRHFDALTGCGLHAIIGRFSEKIQYTGFIIDTDTTPLEIPDRPFVFVHRGSGVACERILLTGLLAAKRHPDTDFYILVGPSADEAVLNKLSNVRLKNTIILKQLELGQFNYVLSQCALSVSMAGYNTTAKTLYFKKPAVILPLDGVEQNARARTLAGLYNYKYISAQDDTLAAICEGISMIGQTPGWPANGIDINGEMELVEWIAGVFNDAAFRR